MARRKLKHDEPDHYASAHQTRARPLAVPRTCAYCADGEARRETWDEDKERWYACCGDCSQRVPAPRFPLPGLSRRAIERRAMAHDDEAGRAKHRDVPGMYPEVIDMEVE